MYCYKCGTENTEDSSFCRECGTRLIVSNETKTAVTGRESATSDSQNIICSKCGTMNKSGSTSCSECGTALYPNEAEKNRKKVDDASRNLKTAEQENGESSRNTFWKKAGERRFQQWRETRAERIANRPERELVPLTPKEESQFSQNKILLIIDIVIAVIALITNLSARSKINPAVGMYFILGLPWGWVAAKKLIGKFTEGTAYYGTVRSHMARLFLLNLLYLALGSMFGLFMLPYGVCRQLYLAWRSSGITALIIQTLLVGAGVILPICLAPIISPLPSPTPSSESLAVLTTEVPVPSESPTSPVTTSKPSPRPARPSPRQTAIATITEDINAPLQVGSTGPEVQEVKEMLVRLGLLSVDETASDDYDGLTVEAVMQFQQEKGLPITGDVDSATLASLRSAVSTYAVPTAQSASVSSGNFDENGFVFADSSERYLTMDELMALSKDMLGFARNEIFARNGNLFRKDKYIDHYTSYTWYQNLPNKRYDVMPEDLNPIERANVNLILEREAQLG